MHSCYVAEIIFIHLFFWGTDVMTSLWCNDYFIIIYYITIYWYNNIINIIIILLYWTGHKIPKRTILSTNNILRVAGVLFKQHIFPFPKPIFWTNQRSCMGSPVSLIVANVYMEAFEHTHQLCTELIKDLEKIYGWYICNSKKVTQGWVFPTYQYSGYIHSIYCWRSWTWWFHPISGHFSNTPTRWNLYHKGV